MGCGEWHIPLAASSRGGSLQRPAARREAGALERIGAPAIFSYDANRRRIPGWSQSAPECPAAPRHKKGRCGIAPGRPRFLRWHAALFKRLAPTVSLIFGVGHPGSRKSDASPFATPAIGHMRAPPAERNAGGVVLKFLAADGLAFISSELNTE